MSDPGPQPVPPTSARRRPVPVRDMDENRIDRDTLLRELGWTGEDLALARRLKFPAPEGRNFHDVPIYSKHRVDTWRQRLCTLADQMRRETC